MSTPNPTMRALLEAQEGGVIIFSPTGMVLYSNTEACSMLGCSNSDAWTDLDIHDLSIPALSELHQAALADQKGLFTSNFTVPRTGLFGEVRVKAIVRKDGVVTGTIALLKDSYREHELDRLKADFLSAVSHELRTPLTSILGYSNLLKEAGNMLNEEDRIQFLDTIEMQGRILLELIDDLIEMTKLDSDGVEIHLSTKSVMDIMAEVAMEHQAESLSCETIIEIEEFTQHIELTCDVSRVRQALGHLVENALKFSPPGRSITLSAHEDNGCVILSVRDTGPGIPQDQQDLIFQRFYQMDSSASRKSNGTGLGLAIVKRIVELHNGSIHVQSTPGQGATFSMVLPRAQSCHLNAA